MNYLNVNLKYLRSKTNWSLNEITQKIEGLSVSSLASYEDRVTPKIETLLALLDLYNQILNSNITLDQLIRTDIDKSESSFNSSYSDLLSDDKTNRNEDYKLLLAKAFLNLTEILKK